MNIVLDLTWIENFFSLPVDIMLRRLLPLALMPVGIMFIWGAKEIWLKYIRTKWSRTVKQTLLAIDIPRNNVQSPRAVENIFTYLAGAHSNPNLFDTYWQGVFQLYFSLEIVSIEGYTQFLIRTPEKFRDLVETAIYSQYPDAEITEVADYAEPVPKRFPDPEYDIFGAEFVLAKPDAFPIKLYKEFEHIFGEPETTFRDPIAALMDLLGSLKKGEQAWYQIILIPTGFDWIAQSDLEVKKILKEKIAPSMNILEIILDGTFGALIKMLELIVPFGESATEEKKTDDALKMMNLKPREKKQVEAIQMKSSKIGFKIKMRFLYVGRKEVFNRPKVFSGFVGYIKQFADNDLNNLKPDMKKTATAQDYFFVESTVTRKKNSLMRNYVNRDDWAGKRPYIMNVEELATIWHFPIESVSKAPLLQKAPGRKAGPPISLPLLEEGGGEIGEPGFLAPTDAAPAFLTESVPEPALDAVGNAPAPSRAALNLPFLEAEPGELAVAAAAPKGSAPENLPFA